MTLDNGALRAHKDTSDVTEGSGTKFDISHELKCWPQFYDQIIQGIKTHELRRCDDRDFSVGDILLLREFFPETAEFTGRSTRVEVTCVTSARHVCALSDQALHPNYCILSVRLIATPGDAPSADLVGSLSTSSLPQIPSIDARVKEHQPTNWRALTDRQIIDAMNADTPVNRVRRVFSGESARLEQAGMQRRTPGPVDYRRMEFEASDKLIAALSQGSPEQ